MNGDRNDNIEIQASRGRKEQMLSSLGLLRLVSVEVLGRTTPPQSLGVPTTLKKIDARGLAGSRRFKVDVAPREVDPAHVPHVRLVQGTAV